MAGRIYGLPGESGVRDGTGCRVFTLVGDKIPMVTRVELDEDANEGMATVTAIVRDEGGRPLVDHQKGEACRATFRTWVRVFEKGEPDPKRSPGRMLWRQEDGTLAPGEDPLPDVPFRKQEAATANV
jgi:hypothetical protein